MIGTKIRDRRKERNLSLRDLGELTGLSASFLSQVENDQTSPSISSLQSIATALRMPMFTFLDGDAPTELVVRADARKKLTFPESRIAYELLTNDLSHQLAGFVIRLEPGASNQARQLFRPTEELMFVVQGEMDILVGERQYHLCAGDSITYEGTRLRSYTNPGTQDLIVVCAMTPPAL